MATLAFTSPGPAEAPECWVDVYNDYLVEDLPAASPAVRDALPETADEAVERGRRDIEADDVESRRRGDSESVSADPEVFAARQTLYAGARPGTSEPSGSSEWVWAEEGLTKGAIVMEQVQGGWRIIEEHFLVRNGRCGA